VDPGEETDVSPQQEARSKHAVEISVALVLGSFIEGAVAGWGITLWPKERVSAIWLVAVAVAALVYTIGVQVKVTNRLLAGNNSTEDST
jgi:hypothetical protein